MGFGGLTCFEPKNTTENQTIHVLFTNRTTTKNFYNKIYLKGSSQREQKTYKC